MILLLLACNHGNGDSGAPTGREPKLRIPVVDAPKPPPRTVVWFTVDTTNQAHLGHDSIHPSSPNHNAIFDEGVLLQNTLVTRGVTVYSLSSIVTGTYPRTHRIDSLEIPPEGEMPPMAQELLGEAGYLSYSYSSNICVVQARGWTKTFCVAGDDISEAADDQVRDQMILDEFLDDLAALPEDADAFFWVHMRDPHATHTPRSPWIEEYYTGDRDDQSSVTTRELEAYTLGTETPDEDFQTWLDAVYASEVASNDDMLGTIRQALEDAGRWDVVFTGTDHGEENGAHHDYYLHGCSTYDPVLNTTWAFRAPDIDPQVVEQRVSTTDILPTTLDLVGVAIPDDVEGRSLVPLANGEDDRVVPVFFQRGPDTAGVVTEGRKYFLHAGDRMPRCAPFDGEQSWPGPSEAVFDLVEDPGELDNLIASEPSPPERELLCEWVTNHDWQDQASAALQLINACRDN